MRVLQVHSRDLDLDTLWRAQDALAGGDEVYPRRVDDSWPSIAREAVMIRRRAKAFDAVCAYGRAAIRAATLFPARLTLEEPGLSDAGPSDAGLTKSRCQHDHPPLREKSAMPGLPPRRDKSRARELLGIAQDAIVVVAPGTSLRDSGHRLAGHAVGLLHYLDPRFQLLLWGHGVEGTAMERLAQGPWDAFLRVEKGASWHDLIDAADAAVYCGTGVVEMVALRTAIDRQLPTAALGRKAMLPLNQAGLFHQIQARSPRAVATAILRALDMTPSPLHRQVMA